MKIGVLITCMKAPNETPEEIERYVIDSADLAETYTTVTEVGQQEAISLLSTVIIGHDRTNEAFTLRAYDLSARPQHDPDQALRMLLLGSKPPTYTYRYIPRSWPTGY